MSGPAPAELVGFRARLGTHTDPGQVRGDNEDRLLVFDLRGRKPIAADATQVKDIRSSAVLMMVADGMGGMSGGETASQMCVDSVPELFLDYLEGAKGTPREKVREALLAAIRETNQKIYMAALGDTKLRGMGCTLTAAILEGDHLLIGQVGDSRCYLGRSGQVQQLTRDQTVWESLRAQGKDPEAALGRSQFKSMLLQAVGAQADVEPVFTELELMGGDWLVLCSDGLYRVVESPQIGEILNASSDPAEKARALTALANKNGGPDNVSVVVCNITSGAAVDKGTPAAA
ncbi:MAG: PP2C family protein-serine/threonine phosphatase [Terriglobales bacterium]